MHDNLTLVPAGAGSGKTYRIETVLAEAVESGQIRPERILAVTFTEAAAADLRERIRGALLKRGRVEDALAIDGAYVGTIHALGLRLLTEHSFAAGRVPGGRLLSETERDLLIRQQMNRAPSLAPILTDLPRFGYSWDQFSGTSAEDQFRQKVLGVIDLLRSLGSRGLAPDVAESALADIRLRYGPTQGGTALQTRLAQAVLALRNAFPTGIAHTTQVTSAKKDFERDFEALSRAVITGALDHDWRLWKLLGKLRCSNRNTKTPEGYDAMAERVIQAAEGLRHHPGPLQDVEGHLNGLIRGAQEIMAAYEADKHSRGLFDYSDMIVESEQLLRTRPDILEAVLGEIDCVIVDEFQDTNPVQFAMLWRLASRAPRALIVGDQKQAIMGFQGADPRLSAALDKAYSQSLDPLASNYRSVPGIMRFVNLIGPRLFPEGYDPLAPAREETGQTALEILEISGKKDEFFDAVAGYVRELVDAAPLVQDRATKEMRPLKISDVAVLTYTRFDAARAATSLRAVDLPVKLPEGGWFASTAVQVVRAALAFTADPTDRFSAMIILSRGPSRMGLDQSLALVMNDQLLSDERLAGLAGFSEQAATMPVSDALLRVLELAGIHEWVGSLPDRQVAEANMGRMLNEAIAFEEAATSLRTAAGFHGLSIQAFLGWLADQAARSLDHCPDAEGWEVDGVELSTWHASKGREWPVTVVAGFDRDLCIRPNTMRAEFASFDDLDSVLSQAGLSWFPSFDCGEVQDLFSSDRIPDDERDAARALYVALTRARDRLVLAVAPPPKKADPDARPKTMGALLRARTGLTTGANFIDVLGEQLPAICRQVTAADMRLPEKETAQQGEWKLPGRPEALPAAARRQWRNSPSSLIADPLARCADLQHEDLGAPCRGRDEFASAADRGTAYHLAFRVLAERPDLADRLAAATGLADASLELVRRNVEAMRHWLADRGFKKLYFEVPLQIVLEDGSQTNAIIDLLAEGDTSFLVVDHKTGRCPDPDMRFAGYHPQLQAYVDVLSETHPHKPVEFVAIHWMDEGRISMTDAKRLELRAA